MAFQADTVNAQNSIFNVVHGDQYNEYVVRGGRVAHTKILQLLRPANYSHDSRTYERARLPHTCEWAMSNETISPWLLSQEAEASRLWLHGNPGTGKSVLGAYLWGQVKQLAAESKEQIVLSFFCKAAGSEKQRTAEVLMGFLRQILERPDRPYDQDVANELGEMLMSERGDYKFTVEDLEPYLVTFLKTFPKIWFIIDALDECENPVALIDVILNLGHGYDVKFLFLSRKEKDIEDRLRHWPTVEIGGDATTQTDMQRFIKKEVAQLTADCPSLSGEIRRLEEGLLTGAGNMFLYAHLKCKTIRESDPSTLSGVTKVINFLEHSPENLDTVYEGYLSQRLANNNAHRNQIALRALQWIMYSPEPVTAAFLHRVLALNVENDEGVCPEDLVGDIEKEVGKALGILVEWRTTSRDISCAVLMHQSLRDYLSRVKCDPPQWTQLPVPHNSILADTAQSGLLATCCVIATTRDVLACLRAYHDSADRRWQLRDDRRGRLQNQLCHQQWWAAWETEQLDSLDQEWKWRKGEEERAKRELREMGDEPGLEEWVKNQKKKVEGLREAQGRQEKEIEKLRALRSLRERDIMIYSFRYLSYHLVRTGQPGLALIGSAVPRLAIQLRARALDVLDHLDVYQPCQSSAQLTGMTDLAISFQNLSTTIDLVDHLMQIDPSMLPGGWSLAYIQSPLFYHWMANAAAHFSVDAHTIWNAEIPPLFEASNPSPSLRHLFALVTLALVDLRNAEFALCNFDEKMAAVVGTGILVHTIRTFQQTLVQRMVFYIFGPAGRVGHLLAEDNFLFPKLLTNPTVRPIFKPPPSGNFWDSYPFRLFVTLLFCLLAGPHNPHPLWVVIMCVISSEKKLYSFQWRHPSFMQQTTRFLPSCLVVFWILSIYLRGGMHAIAKGSASLTIIAGCAFFFLYIFIYGPLHFIERFVDVHLIRARTLRFVLTWDCDSPFIALTTTVLAADKPFATTLNIAAIIFAAHHLLIEVVDHTHLHRARIVLSRASQQAVIVDNGKNQVVVAGPTSKGSKAPMPL